MGTTLVLGETIMREAKPSGGKFADSMMMNPRKAMGVTGDASGGNFGVGPSFTSGMTTSGRDNPGGMLSDSARCCPTGGKQANPDHGMMPRDGYRREGKA